MFDVVINEDTEDRALLLALLQKVTHIMVDLSKLQAAVERNTKAIDALVAAHGDPAAQAAVDAAVVTLDEESAKAEAAVAPVV